jgi:hypothetical protein
MAPTAIVNWNFHTPISFCSWSISVPVFLLIYLYSESVYIRRERKTVKDENQAQKLLEILETEAII